MQPLPPALVTARVRLAAVSPPETAMLARLLQDAYPAGAADALTTDRAASVARFLVAHWARYAYGPYVMELHDGTRIGNAGFKHRLAHGGTWPDDADDVELGFALLAPYRRRGYMTEAVGALLRAAWAAGISSVHARCNVTNTRSAAVLMRSGLREIPSAVAAERHFIAQPA